MLAHPSHAVERAHGGQPAIPIPMRRVQQIGSWTTLAKPASSQHSRCGSHASLMFDLEMEDGDEVEAPRPHQTPRGLPELLGLASRGEERQLWSYALQARDAVLPPGALGNIHVDVEAFTCSLAEAFSGKGLVWLRKGLAAMPCSDPSRATIKHAFAVASVPGLGFYIVDPNFKEQLALSGATEEYGDFLASLPPVLVASAEQLADWLRVACDEMQKVFAAKGVPTPPWREFNTLISRWLLAPGQADDRAVDQLTATGAAAVAGTSPAKAAPAGSPNGGVAVAAVGGTAPLAVPAAAFRAAEVWM